jgi:hypothetical protein
MGSPAHTAWGYGPIATGMSGDSIGPKVMPLLLGATIATATSRRCRDLRFHEGC